MKQPYEKILHAERPVHFQDTFSAKHPPMPREKRAKLFAPFDALAGYGEALDEQEVIYQEREVLSEEKRQELDKKLGFLRTVYRERRQGTKYVGGSLAVKTFVPPCVTIRYFEEVPGQDGRGQYHTVSGAVVKMELSHKCLLMISTTHKKPISIPLEDITAFSGQIFDFMDAVEAV